MENKINKLIEVVEGKYECKFTSDDNIDVEKETSEMVEKTKPKRKRIKIEPKAVYSTTSRDKGFDDDDE
jgi:hypothetical protein